MKTKLILLIISAGMPFAIVQAHAAPTAEQAKEAFMKVDTDQDGTLSLAEWKAAGRKDRGFNMIDADKDGKVTPAELQAAMAKRSR